MWIYSKKDELAHHGIKGMKWGVRRSKEFLARLRGDVPTEDWSDDAKTASALKGKSLKQMTNAEIKKLNERTRLENEYKQLNTRHKSAGEKFVGEILTNSAKGVATKWVTKGMNFGVDYVADYIMGRPKQTRIKFD